MYHFLFVPLTLGLFHPRSRSWRPVYVMTKPPDLAADDKILGAPLRINFVFSGGTASPWNSSSVMKLELLPATM